MIGPIIEVQRARISLRDDEPTELISFDKLTTRKKKSAFIN